MSTFNAVLMVILTILNIFILVKISFLEKSLRTSEVHKKQEEIDSFSDVEMLSSYELERLKREEDFDRRINMLKDELASKRSAVHENTVAEELHPLVKNIPHNAVRLPYEGLPDVEIAE